MNITTLHQNEVFNVSGGFSVIDGFNLFGGTVFAGLATAIYLRGIPSVEGKGIRYGWQLSKACLSLPYLASAAIASAWLTGGGLVFGTIDEKIRGKDISNNGAADSPNKE